MSPFKFSRNYRLKSKKAIATLFEDSVRLKNYPLMLLYGVDNERLDPIIRVAISVPKRKLKRAVDRNKVKRQIRESIKNSAIDLSEELIDSPRSYNLLFIYQDDKINDISFIEKKINLLLKRLISDLRTSYSKPFVNEQV